MLGLGFQVGVGSVIENAQIVFIRESLNDFTPSVKLTDQLLFKTRFRKSGLTYRRQVVNPQCQTPQGHLVAKTGTPL